MATNQHLQQKRHTLAHLTAAAVREIWPGSQNAIGPAIDNGFYQDFEIAGTVTDADLPKIEKKIKELLPKWTHFEKKEVTKEEALKEFAWNRYKTELIEEFAQEGKKLTFHNSPGLVDLCKGGHVENPAKEIDPKAFKLTHIAGAYWRGNEKNKMLTRIYGVAFDTKEELDKYLVMMEEAKKRDHKKLGPQLDLFTFSDLVGAGLPLWTPKGALVRELLDNFVWELRKTRGYQKVEIPHITKKELYEISGHWDKFKDELFRIKTREGHEFAMKPMNCPHHTQIYARKQHSYRDLPIRFCNTTTCYRDEQTGELSGLARVRAFSQDDAHIFARTSQIKREFMDVWDIVDAFYGVAGYKLTPELSFSNPNEPQKYMGTREMWEQAEKALTEIVAERGVKAEIIPGEAAFYGPKIDFIAQDSLGRELQVATIQLDVNMPERFDLSCVNEEGKAERIVMIHAAIMGSIERFLSVYIEHTAGAFPVWLAPTQVSILPISEKQVAYAEQVQSELISAISDLRIELDSRNESVGKKIREASMQKVPYMIIVGDKEMAEQKIAVRGRGEVDLGVLAVPDFTQRLQEEISAKT